MAQWQWQTKNGTTYLSCELLDCWAHGFFTQASWPQTPTALTQVLNPEADVFRVKQVHGNRVMNTSAMVAVIPEAAPNSASSNGNTQAGNIAQSAAGKAFDEADGIFASGQTQAVWACSADCTPALLGDVKTGQVAAVHAGWRGTAAQILPEAVALFLKQGSQVADLRVALGPAIDGSVYQVDGATAVKTGKMLIETEGVEEDGGEEEILRALMALPLPPVLPDEEVGKARLDVRRVNGLQLEKLGLTGEQYSIAPHCTFQEPQHFFSYRRTGEKKVQWSGIVSR